MKYMGIILTLIFVTYGQLIIKYEINRLGTVPTNTIWDIGNYFFRALTNIGIISGLFAAFLAALSWMSAMSKFELTSV